MHAVQLVNLGSTDAADRDDSILASDLTEPLDKLMNPLHNRPIGNCRLTNNVYHI
jgi:hypothetical protein